MKKPTLLDKIIAAFGEAVKPIQQDVEMLHAKVNHVSADVEAINARVQAMPVPVPALRLCRDCRYIRAEKTWFAKPNIGEAYCGRPNMKDSKFLVTGVGHEFCNVERNNYHGSDTCGTAGKYFEPRS